MANQLEDIKFIDIYRMMQRIRLTELEIAKRYNQGEMRCPTHLSVGQECVPAVLSTLLNKQDQAVSTHRAHAHYLGKGGDLNAMLAEIYGKITGCSLGRGGSMHLIDEKVGFMGSTAIVGNTIPIGVGLALAKKIKQQDGLVVVFVGDGAIEEGVFYEAANFAATQRLPVLFVCENNLYSVYSPLSKRQPKGRKIHELASSIGLQSYHADGNDVLKAYTSLETCIRNIRANKGPAFIELATYRWLEHCGPNYDNDIGYRSEKEFLHWKEKDPLVNFRQQLVSHRLSTETEITRIDKDIKSEILAGFKYAEDSPLATYLPSEHPVFASGLNNGE